VKRRKPDRSDHVPVQKLENDTRVNVSRLLQEMTGASRDYRLTLDWFALDADLMARDVHGKLRLMRVMHGILLVGAIEGVALIECVRCLEIYEQPFATEVDQEYRSMYDSAHTPVDDGGSESDPDGEIGEIDEANEIDLAEPIRQFTILSLPMRPDCGPDCPGTGIEDESEPEGDRRLAVLAELLDEAAETGES
jgi:uncharacterized protein